LIIFANKLTLADFGKFILLRTLTSTGIAGTLLNFGYKQFVAKKIALYSDREKNKKKNLIASKSYFNLFTITLFISLFALILNNVFETNLFFFIKKEDNFHLLLNLIFFIWIIEIPLTIFTYALEGIQKNKQIKIINFIFNFLFFLGFVFAIYNNYGYEIIFVLYLLLNLFKNLFITKYYLKFFDFYFKLRFIKKIYLFENKNFFYNLIFGNFLSLIIEFGEKYFIVLFLSIEYIAIIEALNKIPKLLKSICGFINVTFLTQCSKYYSKEKINNIGYFLYNNLHLNILIIFIPIIILAIFSEQFFHFFFTHEIAENNLILIIFFIPSIAWIIHSIFGNLTTGTGLYLNYVNFFSVIQVFTKFLIMFLFVSDFKIYSFAFGYLSNILLIPVYFYFINKILNNKIIFIILKNYFINSSLYLAILLLILFNNIFFQSVYLNLTVILLSILFTIFNVFFVKNIFLNKFFKILKFKS
jgi:O-antigen/teichoic acid export membrane protein